MSANSVDLSSFTKEYIWGFTQETPMRYSDNQQAFYELISLLTGNKGTVTIGASFHPYQLIDRTGNDLWETVFNVIKANNFCDYGKLINEKLFFHMNPPGPKAFPIMEWPDKRLFPQENPEFEKFVPFVIPYLTHNDGQVPKWQREIEEAVIFYGNAQEYIEGVNETARFFMPEPTFIIGFDTFDKNDPSRIVHHFVEFMENNIRKR